MEKIKSAYIHLPFCETKCHYCDFYSFAEASRSSEQKQSVYAAIVSEVRQYVTQYCTSLSADESFGFQTIFLGGGTPSLLPLHVLDQLMAELPLSKDAEITLEANPSSISFEKAKHWKSLGINRISMGMQALNDDRLKWLGRVHDSKQTFQALDHLVSAGFTNFSVDYIVGVPGQTTQDITAELYHLLQKYPGLKHLSAYLLTLKPGNPKFVELPNEEEQLLHLETVSRFLIDHHFEQYEISNFAQKGFQAQHNQNYWLGHSYVGFGPSAHSYDSALKQRSKKWSNLKRYCEDISNGVSPLEWTETLTLDQLRTEYLMLRLRRAEGIDLLTYRNYFKKDLLEEKNLEIDALEQKGLCQLSHDKSHLFLTRTGFFLSDQIVSNLM